MGGWRFWPSAAAVARLPGRARQGRAQQVEARGAGKSVFLDDALNQRRHCGVFGVGEANRWHGGSRVRFLLGL